MTSLQQQIVHAATSSSATTTSGPSMPSTSHTQGPCSNIDYLWAHTYDPTRLKVQNSCLTITGMVEDTPRHEPDGDTHFILTLDPKYTYLSQPNNCVPSTKNCNRLIVEIICHNFPIDSRNYPKAVAACANYHSGINDPYQGEHVSVSGRWVLDTDHGSWGEIHPASDIHMAKKTASVADANMTRQNFVPAGENTP